jgi:hypothetical protein
MTAFNANDFKTLTGKTLKRIEIEDGQAAFFTEDKELYVIHSLFGAFQDGPDTVDGDLRNVIETPITNAYYDIHNLAYVLESEHGEVRILCPGSRTGFRREQ